MSMYCCYKDCSSQHRAFSSKPFFNLPTDSRREIWIKNSGNGNSDIDWNKRKMFCVDHFDPKDLRVQFNRTTLRRDAIPIPYSADSHEVEFIEMAESEDEEQKNGDDEQNDSRSYVIVINSPPKTKRLRFEPKEESSSVDLDINVNESTQKSGSNENELITPTNHSMKRMESHQKPKSTQKSKTQTTIPIRIAPDVAETMTENQQIVTENSSRPFEVCHEQITLSNPVPVATVPNNGLNDVMVSSSEKIDSNNEETYFALSLVGILKRLPPHKRAIAKCHILSYLTKLEYGSSELSN